MAGIGFVLRELDRRESVLGAASSAGHGMIVAAGPWIFTVISLALIHRGTSTVLSSEVSYNFRSFVMYAFAISLLATAPVVNVSIRLASDDIYRRDFAHVRSRYVAAVLGSCLASGVTALGILLLVFGLGAEPLLIGVGSTVIVGLIWPTLAFCGAVRDYKGITSAFVLGMLISILGTIWIARHQYGTPAMMMTFLVGLSVVFFGLASRILIAFPNGAGTIGTQMMALIGGLRQNWMLAVGSFAAIAAIWADKWVMWFGPDQVVLANGLASAPDYDGAMFLAYLVMIPALGLFVTAIETTFFEDSRRLLDAIHGRAPLGRIERLSTQFEKRTYQTIYRVLMTLGALCALAILLSPTIAPWLGLRYQQLGIFRLGILSAFFQFIFLSASSIILFLDRQIRFCLLQVIFLCCQIAFTLITIQMGHQYSGYGHLVACALSALVAMAVLDSTLTKIVYLTFASALRRPAGRMIPVPARTPAVQPEERPEEIDFDEEILLPVLPVIQQGPLLRP